MRRAGGIWAVVPVKEFADAKQRLAPALAAAQRRRLAAAMLQDVLAVLAAAPALAGLIVVTCDPEARALAERFGARIIGEHARAGQTAAVTAAASMLAREGADGMLAVPGDIPLIEAAEVAAVLAAHGPPPAFTIVPAHDGRGSNAVLCSPPDAVPLAFGNDSFQPHLEAARGRGIEPMVLRLPGIGLDIDNPADLAQLVQSARRRRIAALAVLAAAGLDSAVA